MKGLQVWKRCQEEMMREARENRLAQALPDPRVRLGTGHTSSPAGKPLTPRPHGIPRK